MSDIARVYANGKEPAKYNPNLDLPEASGREKATVKNADLGHDYQDDRTK